MNKDLPFNRDCEGFCLSGYWKGKDCGNKVKYQAKDGRWYCHLHIGVGENEPEKFDYYRTKD